MSLVSSRSSALKRRIARALVSLALVALPTVAARAQTVASAPVSAETDGAAVFQAKCQSCHMPPVGRAPSRADLSRRPAADIYTALTKGIMAPMAEGLSPDQIRAVSRWLGMPERAELGDGKAAAPPMRRPPLPVVPTSAEPRCTAPGHIRPAAGDWAEQGADARSRRYQPAPGLTAADLPRLKLKWAFSMTGGGQPVVVGDWLFVTNRNGRFYALDAGTGCVRWVLEDVVSRTTPMVVRSAASPSGWATFVGVSGRRIRAYDAETGQQIWQSEPVETHPVAVLTGSPVVSGDRLFVPVSSLEEVSSINPAYPCCTFSGSVAALDLRTGAILWRTKVIPEVSRSLRRNAAGTQMYGPAGAAIWSAPEADAARGLVYVATGDSYTDADTVGSDAVVALDMATGAVRWRRQVTAGDNFIMGCQGAKASANCPSPVGPDYDFGATPILMRTASGKDVLLAGQKSGQVYGLDPDTGAVRWTTAVGAGSALGGVEWGMSADPHRLYVPISDVGLLYAEIRAETADPTASLPPDHRPARPGLSALDPESGRILWTTPAPRAPCHYGPTSMGGHPPPCMRAQSAAPTSIPGVVFSGTMDGWLRAYDAKTGHILWSDSTTARTYDTLNGIKGQPGGSIDGLGATVAHGRVYVMSGFDGAARVGGNGMNVLLAYSVDGR